MSSVGIGLALALAASLALNTGYLLQHSGSIHAPDITPRHPLATLRSLLASRPWVAGLALGTLGWTLHVGALSKAPISLVQAFVAGGLALALPIGRWLFRHRVTGSELWGICLMAAALAALAVGIHDHGAHGHFHSLRLALYLAASLAAAGLLAASPAGPRRPQPLGAAGPCRPHALGVAGGLLYGSADVAIKAVTGLASRHGVWHALLGPWPLLAAVATVGAFFCFQRGLQTGRALPVIALMTAATNALSIAAGFVVFNDSLGGSGVMAAVHAGALAVIVAAGSLLAPAQNAPAPLTS